MGHTDNGTAHFGPEGWLEGDGEVITDPGSGTGGITTDHIGS